MAAFCYYLAWEWINISLEYTAAAWLKLPRFFLACVAVNMLTHPLFTLLLAIYGYEFKLTLPLESVIFTVEAAVLTAVYGRCRLKQCVLAAFLMNATSFFTGLFLNIK